MNKLNKSLLGAIVLVSFSGFATANDMVENYATSSDGAVVTTGFGGCLRTSYKDTTEKLVECGYPAPVMEVEVVTAPTAATITAKVVEKFAIAAKMLFAFDSAELSDDAKAVIDERINNFKGGAKLTSIMQVDGYTCNMGPEAYNQKLSERRAQAVADYIAENAPNVNTSDIKVVGMGEANPVASNDTKAGREQNRRVEIIAEGEMIKKAE